MRRGSVFFCSSCVVSGTFRRDRWRRALAELDGRMKCVEGGEELGVVTTDEVGEELRDGIEFSDGRREEGAVEVEDCRRRNEWENEGRR